MSSVPKIIVSPNIVAYRGPGNATVSNSDYSEYYSTLLAIKATNIFVRDSACQPDDDLLQTFTLDNTTLSLVDNDFQGERMSVNALLLTTESYRAVEAYVKNDHYVNVENSAFSMLYLIGEPINKIFLTN